MDFVQPLKWEAVPTEGSDFGLECYRARIDAAKGWLVLVMVPNPALTQTGQSGMETEAVDWRRASVTYVPDEGQAWGR